MALGQFVEPINRPPAIVGFDEAGHLEQPVGDFREG